MKKPVKFIALCKMKPGINMSKEEFKKRWIEEHSKVAAKMKNLKAYKINIHMDELTQVSDYIGTGELYWDSIEEMQEDFNSELGKIAVADGDEFLETTLLYTDEYIVK